MTLPTPHDPPFDPKSLRARIHQSNISPVIADDQKYENYHRIATLLLTASIAATVTILLAIGRHNALKTAVVDGVLWLFLLMPWIAIATALTNRVWLRHFKSDAATKRILWSIAISCLMASVIVVVKISHGRPLQADHIIGRIYVWVCAVPMVGLTAPIVFSTNKQSRLKHVTSLSISFEFPC